MKSFFAAIGNFFAGLGIGLLFLVLGYGISWIATCGIVALVFLIFGWDFSWLIATGIWLILCVAKWIFGRSKG